MPDTNEPSKVLGIKFKKDADDAPFMRFFDKVQSEAMRQHGKVFFLDTSEGGEVILDDIECANLSGWLVSPEDVAEFEPSWRAMDGSIPLRLDKSWCVAEWSGDPHDPDITFSEPEWKWWEEEGAAS